jgi:hypothetical protein
MGLQKKSYHTMQCAEQVLGNDCQTSNDLRVTATYTTEGGGRPITIGCTIIQLGLHAIRLEINIGSTAVSTKTIILTPDDGHNS